MSMKINLQVLSSFDFTVREGAVREGAVREHG